MHHHSSLHHACVIYRITCPTCGMKYGCKDAQGHQRYHPHKKRVEKFAKLVGKRNVKRK